MRVCIDERIFVGLWYTVQGKNPKTKLPSIKRNMNIVDPPDPVVIKKFSVNFFYSSRLVHLILKQLNHH